MKSIREIMSSPPQTCKENETLQTAANQMAISNIGFLPVVDVNDRVIGTITDRDICLELGQNGKPAEATMVKEAMEPNVSIINADDDIMTALKVMRQKKVGRLPVVDKGKRLLGVVSLNDILRASVGTTDMAEVAFRGSESVINTMVALARRNEKVEYDEEVLGEEE